MEAFLRLLFGDEKGCTPKRKFLATAAFTCAYLWLRQSKGGDLVGERSPLEPRLFKAGNSDAEMDRKLIEEIRGFRPSLEKRVIAYSLTGSEPRFTRGAVRNAELAGTYFPGWVCRFYVDETVPTEVTDELTRLGAEIVRKEGPNDGFLFWRYEVADDPEVDRFIVRDVETRLNSRDRFAVEEWISSAAGVHIVRDHLCHGYAMTGGLWGAKHGAIPQPISALTAKCRDKDGYIDSAICLSDKVFPLVAQDHIAHDAYTCRQHRHAFPFPTRRPDSFQHVGQIFDENDRPETAHISTYLCGGVMMYYAAPEACRRHPSWTFG